MYVLSHRRNSLLLFRTLSNKKNSLKSFEVKCLLIKPYQERVDSTTIFKLQNKRKIYNKKYVFKIVPNLSTVDVSKIVLKD